MTDSDEITNNKSESKMGEVLKRSFLAFQGVYMAIIAAIVSIGVSLILITISGIDPIESLKFLFLGSLGSKNGFAEVLVRFTPLTLAALGISVAFRCGIWNIGAEGQIFLGALGAALTGLYLPETLPGAVHLFLVIIAGFVFGGFWGGLVGFMKAYLNANEIIVTIMMNYVAALFVGFLVSGPIRDPSALIPQPQTAKLPQSVWLPRIIEGTRAHAGVILAIVLALLVWFLFSKTTLGYNIVSIGLNPKAALHGGINVKNTIIYSMIISGGIAGLAGVGEVCGLHRYLVSDISPGYGFLAIAVALLGGLNPFGILFSSLFFSILMVGTESMQRAMGVPISLIYLVQGTVIAVILIQQSLRRNNNIIKR